MLTGHREHGDIEMATNKALATEIRANAEANASLAKSVVARKYKIGYAERAITARGKKGVDKRVLADSNGDWLAAELAALIHPNKRKPCDLDTLRAILSANGVDYSNLPVGTPNWQGRFSMNGRQMLRTAIAEADGEWVIPAYSGLYTSNSAERIVAAPRTFVKRYSGK
jgi:hypothetical protein